MDRVIEKVLHKNVTFINQLFPPNANCLTCRTQNPFYPPFHENTEIKFHIYL